MSAHGGRSGVVELNRSSTVDEVVGYVLRRGVSELNAVRATGTAVGSADRLHDARVATRRLRCDLRTVAPLLDRSWIITVRAQVRWLADVLGAVRDVDVLLGELESLRGDLVAIDPDDVTRWTETLGRQLDAERERAAAVLARATASARFTRLIDQLNSAVLDPPYRPAVRPDVRARPLARRLVRRAWNDVADAAATALRSGDVEDLHDVRKLAKRARYAAELVGPLFSGERDRFVRRLSEVQAVLGEHQDMVVLEAWLLALPEPVASDTAFVTGQLVQLARARRAEAFRRWPRVFVRAAT